MSFESFCQDMYVRNCEERKGYKDAVLSYEEYIRVNENFLLDKYREICDNQV